MLFRKAYTHYIVPHSSRALARVLGKPIASLASSWVLTSLRSRQVRGNWRFSQMFRTMSEGFLVKKGILRSWMSWHCMSRFQTPQKWEKFLFPSSLHSNTNIFRYYMLRGLVIYLLVLLWIYRKAIFVALRSCDVQSDLFLLLTRLNRFSCNDCRSSVIFILVPCTMQAYPSIKLQFDSLGYTRSDIHELQLL